MLPILPPVNTRQAIDTIRERNPFPAICGRICHHPCEFRCRRGELDEPVAIRALKRFAADWYFEHVTEDPEPFPQNSQSASGCSRGWAYRAILCLLFGSDGLSGNRL